jgi:inward rectifier potassium channel
MNVNDIYHRIKEFQDSGFSSKVDTSKKSKRLINKDGTFNVVKKGLPFFERFSFYHYLVSISWTSFVLFILASYFVVNLFFAICYYFIGTHELIGIIAQNETEHFVEAFFFSVQTLTTIGYGRISPVGIAASSLASVEGLIGLIGFAMATGLFYGRFARPLGKIIYSHNAVIAPYQGQTAFMFRLANAFDNQLIDCRIKVMVAFVDGNQRKFTNIDLERDTVTFLTSSWTVVHPINEDSPFWEMDAEQMKQADMEVLFLLKGFDDINFQEVQAKGTFKYHEIEMQAKYTPILSDDEAGNVVVQLNRLGDYEKVEV